MSQLKQRALLILLGIGLLAAVIVAAGRIRTESANRNVALAVDLQDLQRVAALSGKPISELLKAVKERGVTHVAMTEWSLGDLLGGMPYPAPYMLPPNVREQLDAKFPNSEVTTDASGRTLSHLLPFFRDLGVGYDLHTAEAIRSAYGLGIIARPRPEFSGSPTGIEASLTAAQATGAKIVIFEGTEVLGNTAGLAATADGMTAHGLAYGMVELVPQLGDFALAKHLHSDILRVHSISEAEMAQDMTPARAVDRFALAVKERKVRLCYLRLFFNQGDPLAANLDYIGQVSEAIKTAGFTPGEPGYFALPAAGRVFHVALYLALGAAALWLLQEFLGLSIAWFWGLFGVLVLDAIVEGAAGMALSADLGAFLGAVIFASAGILLLRQPERPAQQPVRRAVLAFMAISGISLAGGLIVAATLTDMPHLMSVVQFRGVKLAEVLPLLLIGLVLVARAMPKYTETRLELGEGKSEVYALREGLIQACSNAVRYWHAALILVIMVVVAVVLVRSGNESPVAPTGFERMFRSLLDHLLWVRPRTKEIFFGHPLLLVSLILFYRGHKRGVWLGLTLGVIGQISLLNTFCHLHTPILYSLVRAFHGIWIGLLIGLAVWWVIQKCLTWWEKRLAAEDPSPAAGQPDLPK